MIHVHLFLFAIKPARLVPCTLVWESESPMDARCSSEDTLRRFRDASDPRASAWVTANAGTGKTYVLMQRVVRLLLDGAHPSKLLCLTFTKAAAATMAERVLSRLASWVRMSTCNLTEELTLLNGKTPDENDIARARCLFAEILEARAGLKIQTIHAFCDRLLRHFHSDSGLTSDFEVIDENEARELIEEAKNQTIAQAWTHPQSIIGRSVLTAVNAIGEYEFNKALNVMVEERDWFIRLLQENGSLSGLLQSMHEVIVGKQDDTRESLSAEIISCPFIQGVDVTSLTQRLLSGAKKDVEQARRLILALDTNVRDERERSQYLISLFLNSQGQPRRQFGVTRAIHDEFPGLEKAASREAQRLIELQNRQKAVEAFELNSSLMCIGEAVIKAYQDKKARRMVLDFEDLISQATNLLSFSEDATWVQYKLYQEIEHILLDEAQDVSAKQWGLIDHMTSEFFSSITDDEKPRTLFVVGDPKQSIYSFRQAHPREFSYRESLFLQRSLWANQTMHRLSLQDSFRSPEDILDAVDIVFGCPDTRLGVEIKPWEKHRSARTSLTGQVEIWPLIEGDSGEMGDEDVANRMPMSSAQHAAIKIADHIEEMLASGVILASTDQAIRPRDIMVLVRKRGEFTESLNRLLRRRGVQVIGADRLKLFQHIVVLDLLALGRVMLLPEDDLSLAVVLKSPLIDCGDQDLIDLARSRTDGEPLYATLKRKALSFAGEELSCTSLGRKSISSNACRACAKLERWRDVAQKHTTFEFYTKVLKQDGQLKRFLIRFGEEAAEVIDEFLSIALAYEQKAGPSLAGFLEYAEHSGLELKREINTGRDEVQVTTVHGAKGLEAPIVFVVDSAGNPQHSSYDPEFLAIPDCRKRSGRSSPSFMCWNVRQARSPALFRRVLKDAKDLAMEEYCRLLYVAMTRASDRLIIAGYTPKSGVHPDSWIERVGGLLKPHSRQRLNKDGTCSAWIFNSKGFEVPEQNQMDHGDTARSEEEKIVSHSQNVPDWLWSHASRSSDT